MTDSPRILTPASPANLAAPIPPVPPPPERPATPLAAPPSQAWQVDLPLPAPHTPPRGESALIPPETAKPLNLKADFDKKDTSNNGKLNRKESGFSLADFKKADTDGDGRLTRQEYRGAYEKSQAFTTLDADGDKKLSTDEMQKLQRFTRETYDTNQDGHVDETEFDQRRAEELQAARIALRSQEYAELTPGDKKKLASLDANQDGQLTQAEYFAGRAEQWRARRDARIVGIFSTLAGSASTLKTAKAGMYAKYDRDQDGKITQAEFQQGQIASYQESYRERRLFGEVKTAALRTELGVNRNGTPLIPTPPAPESEKPKPQPAAKTTAPVSVNNLKNLTHAQALDLIKAQGGVPPRPGSPTVLAIRTESANSRGWEDHFVVLKANGDMKTFAATTRPSYTSSSGVGMLLPGNYRLTPRWKDHKWRNAFIVNTQNGSMNVRVARDHNSDGRYTGKERTKPGSSVNIRLHPGVNGAPSSAGCLNVKDYDAFIRYMGGTNVRFPMTLIET